MKKFWEKHDLVKLSGLMVLITVLMTWVFPKGYYQGELVVEEITRVGIFDFFTYGLLGMYYFTVLVTFMFVLGGFYQVLSKTGGYQKLTESIAKKFNGKEIIFVVSVSFVIAALTAIMNEYFVLLAFLPFIITILSKMKLDKITGFVTTFGSVLIGILGTVYSSKIVGQSIYQLEQAGITVGFNDYLWVKLVIFAVAFIAFSVFNVLHVSKTLKAKKADEIEDLFVTEEVNKKNKVWPIALIFGLFALVTIMAYLPWEELFNVTFFKDLVVKMNEAEVFGSPIWSYIFGSVSEFGAWDVFGVQVVMLITTLIVKWVYKISTNDFITAYGEGLKRVGKLVVLLLMAYLVLEFAVMYPVIPVITDWLMNLSKGFNVFIGVIAGLFTSLFSVEYQYGFNLVGAALATNYAAAAKQITILFQATYGLASLFVPSSVILLMGLSYLGISYKEWFKYIWKFLLIMFAVIVILMLIIF